MLKERYFAVTIVPMTGSVQIIKNVNDRLYVRSYKNVSVATIERLKHLMSKCTIHQRNPYVCFGSP